MNGLAAVYRYTGRWDEAASLYRRALAIVARASPSPERDPNVATLFHNLGGLEHSRGRFGRAEPYARRSVAIRERALGKAHPAVAADVAALAAILDGRGKHAEAERFYKRAIIVFASYPRGGVPSGFGAWWQSLQVTRAGSGCAPVNAKGAVGGRWLHVRSK